MDANTLLALVLSCAPLVHHHTALALINAESSANPWAIGVVGGALVRQPQHKAEALSTATELARRGHNFSVGLGQINVGNFARLGITVESAFEPCVNLRAMQTVLLDCLDRAPRQTDKPPQAQNPQHALQRALSCYYSGNFVTGFRHGYVHRVLQAAARARPTPPPPTSEELK